MNNIPWCRRLLVLALLVLLAASATAQVEVGDNDFHVSSVPFNLGDFDTSAADVAYNSTDHEFLVVFEGDAPATFCNVLFPIRTIFARRIDAATGALIDENIVPVSRSCDNLREAFAPEVAYNSAENEYLVVWEADEDTNGSSFGAADIFGQLLSADLAVIGSEAFRISDMGR